MISDPIVVEFDKSSCDTLSLSFIIMLICSVKSSVMQIKIKLNTLHSTGESYLYTFNYIVKFYLLLPRFGCLLKSKSILKEFFFIGFMRGVLLVGRDHFARLWSSKDICVSDAYFYHGFWRLGSDCHFIWASIFTNCEPSHQP